MGFTQKTLHSHLLKFLFAITSSVATAQFAIYKFLGEPTQGFYICQTFLSSIVFIASLLLYLSMLQNRLYFVYVARQINSLRRFFLENESPEFKDNQLYTSTDFPAIKFSSIHSFQLLGAALLSSLFAASSIYSFFLASEHSPLLWLVFVVFIIVLLSEVCGGAKYLYSAGKKSADEAIHRN